MGLARHNIMGMQPLVCIRVGSATRFQPRVHSALQLATLMLCGPGSETSVWSNPDPNRDLYYLISLLPMIRSNNSASEILSSLQGILRNQISIRIEPWMSIVKISYHTLSKLTLPYTQGTLPYMIGL